MSCPTPQGAAAALPRCVGLEGSPPYPAFFLELTGFDVPAGYVGVDGKAAGHVLIEARPQPRSPSRPCIGGVELATVPAGPWATTEYSCPADSLRVEREARHGEGAYVGHLVLSWSQNGVNYIASVHGHTTANVTFLKQLVTSVTLVAAEASPDPALSPRRALSVQLVVGAQ